jgi:hypothetical protein
MDSITSAFAADISLDTPWELVTAFSRQPRELPEDANRGAEMILDRLHALGLPAQMLQATLYMSNPIAASVACGGVTYRAKPPAFSTSVPAGLTAPLVYVDASSKPIGSDRMPTAYDPAIVGGRIVVTEGMALPYVVGDFEAAGAIGVIAVNPGKNIHWGTVSTIWGTPGVEDIDRLPGIPSAAVNNPDGLALIAAAKAGRSATLVTEMRTGWHLAKMPYVVIPGVAEPEKFVLLHGHYDSWDVGVGDNATGNACLLEVARVLWKNRRQLRRSVRVVWWAGHSTARYGGSTWFADAFAMDLARNCVVHMNCDSPGCRDAATYPAISATPECESIVKDVVRATTGKATTAKRPARNSDYSFHNIGISACFMASSMMPPELVKAKGWYHVGGCGGNIAWHTEDDQMDVADPDVLKRDIGVYLGAALAFANAERLPIDFALHAADLRAALNEYQQAVGTRFDLSPAVAALDALDRRVATLNTAPVPKFNDSVLRLARVLVPLNFASGPRFTHDPAVNLPAIPPLSLCTQLDRWQGDDLHFAMTSLLRGRNRVEAALHEASDIIDRALA